LYDEELDGDIAYELYIDLISSEVPYYSNVYALIHLTIPFWNRSVMEDFFFLLSRSSSSCDSLVDGGANITYNRNFTIATIDRDSSSFLFNQTVNGGMES